VRIVPCFLGNLGYWFLRSLERYFGREKNLRVVIFRAEFVAFYSFAECCQEVCHLVVFQLLMAGYHGWRKL
jgi:hypothetical protein